MQKEQDPGGRLPMRGLMRVLVPLLLATGAAVAAAQDAAPVAAPADSGSSLRVVEMGIGTEVERARRSLTGEGEVFPATVGRLCCLTRVVGAADTTSVTHVWYHEGKTRARVVLPVRSPDWRTWSCKRILPAWTGRWEVVVLDGDGLVVARRAFRIEPVASGATGEDKGGSQP